VSPSWSNLEFVESKYSVELKKLVRDKCFSLSCHRENDEEKRLNHVDTRFTTTRIVSFIRLEKSRCKSRINRSSREPEPRCHRVTSSSKKWAGNRKVKLIVKQYFHYEWFCWTILSSNNTFKQYFHQTLLSSNDTFIKQYFSSNCGRIWFLPYRLRHIGLKDAAPIYF
jgi:hypothetical protein